MMLLKSLRQHFVIYMKIQKIMDLQVYMERLLRNYVQIM